MLLSIVTGFCTAARLPAPPLPYPTIGYREFCALYDSGQIAGYKMRGEVNGIFMMEGIARINRARYHDIKFALDRADGQKADAVLDALQRQKAYDVRAVLADAALPDREYSYKRLAQAYDEKGACTEWIRLKGLPHEAGSRCVVFEPMIFAEAVKTLTPQPAIHPSL